MKTVTFFGWMGLLAACGASLPTPVPSPRAPAAAAEVTPPVRFAFVDDELRPSGDFDDGPITLINMGFRCVGELRHGRIEGCQIRSRVRIAMEGDALATLVPPQTLEAPAVEVDAPLHAGFRGHSLEYVIESAPGDALCPGSPTDIRFFDGQQALGNVQIDAPVARQLGQGVRALLMTGDDAFVVLGWGRDDWRIVSVQGETLAEANVAPDSDCDCCE